MDNTENKELFLSTFRKNVQRPGAEKLLAWMETTDFFTAPASTRFHAAYEGGLLDHSMKELRFHRVGGAVIDLLPLAAGDDQPRRAEGAQVVRQRGRGHLHTFGKLNHAFFAVAEDEKQAHARRVAQVFEKLRRRLKRRGILRRGMQMMFAHTTFSPFAPFFAQTEGPFAQSEEVVRKPLRGRSQSIILRSQRINKCLIVESIDRNEKESST